MNNERDRLLSSNFMDRALTRYKPKLVAGKINDFIKETKAYQPLFVPKTVRENLLGKSLSFNVNSLFN